MRLKSPSWRSVGYSTASMLLLSQIVAGQTPLNIGLNGQQPQKANSPSYAAVGTTTIDGIVVITYGQQDTVPSQTASFLVSSSVPSIRSVSTGSATASTSASVEPSATESSVTGSLSVASESLRESSSSIASFSSFSSLTTSDETTASSSFSSMENSVLSESSTHISSASSSLSTSSTRSTTSGLSATSTLFPTVSTSTITSRVLVPTTSLSTSAVNGYPTGVPLYIYNTNSTEPTDKKLVHIAFNYSLNYDFVANSSISQTQIFTNLPLGIAQPLEISESDVIVTKIGPYAQKNFGTKYQTIASVYIPPNKYRELRKLLHNRKSKLYNNQDVPLAGDLVRLIDTSVPLQGGLNTPESGRAEVVLGSYDVYGNLIPGWSTGSTSLAVILGSVLGTVFFSVFIGLGVFLLQTKAPQPLQI